MSNLTIAELKLASELLDLASNVFSNRVCNDFDLSFLPVEERREVLKAFHDYNGDPENYDENNELITYDYGLMEYLSERIKEIIESQEVD